MNSERLLKRLAQGALQNVAFHDMTKLIESFGFKLHRVTGSHHIFMHPEVPELVNLQNVRGEAQALSNPPISAAGRTLPIEAKLIS